MRQALENAARRHFPFRRLWALAVGAALLLSLYACGSRTALLVFEAPPDAAADVTTADVHVASCIPRTCASAGYGCGANGDGCGNVIECGSCAVAQVCGAQSYSQCAAGTPNCRPKTCADLGFTCGPASDGCGNLLQCGICQYPDQCGGGGTHAKCGNPLPCTNLCLQQVACPAGGTTSVTGTVVAGTLPQYGSPDPIYNAIVYVPNAPVAPFAQGVQCSQCDSEVSGDPLVATQTAPDGTFTLVNVPVGTNIPLVIQLGRWRRQVTIPNVAPCTSTALPTELTRMPRNPSEGDIPLIAVATGEADQTECVLLKMGLDQAQFTQPSGGGRVQFYVGNGSDIGPGTPAGEQLWGNPQTLAQYDMVVLPCMGMPINESVTDQQNLIAYTSAGGRVFATHYSYAWLYNDPPFSGTAQWAPNGNPGAPDMLVGTIDTSFVEGQNFASWLQNVGALSGPGQISLQNVRDDVVGINPPTQQFIYTFQQVLQLGFFTPVGAPAAQQCGRVVYTDFHVSGVANINDAGLSIGTTFPAECSPDPLTQQEKALEFMLFDLASCVPPQPQNCTPLTCAQQNIGCGPAGDGCGGQIDCGSCFGGATCGAGGVYGQCGYPDAGTCTPRTCTEQGFTCGANGDGCGNVIQCGTCTPPSLCGGGGQPSVCGAP